jgi:hypothetical protein
MGQQKKSCNNCKKAVKSMGSGYIRCYVLKNAKYSWDKYGECWAWTNDKYWREKILIEVIIYLFKKPKKKGSR